MKLAINSKKTIYKKRVKKPYIESQRNQSCMTPWRWKNQDSRMYNDVSDEDEHLLSKEQKEYDIGDQLPVFPVAMTKSQLNIAGLGKRTESGDSGISISSVYSSISQSVTFKEHKSRQSPPDEEKIDNVRYQAQFPDRFRDDESSDEFNSGAGQTYLSFRGGDPIEDVFSQTVFLPFKPVRIIDVD